MAGGAYVVTGLRELNRDLRAAGDKAGRRELYRGLRAAGNVIRDRIREHAAAQGLEDTGALIRGVRVTRANPGNVTIESTAKNRSGFAYPSLYEYARGRPFMVPGAEEATPEAVTLLERRMDALLREHNL